MAAADVLSGVAVLDPDEWRSLSTGNDPFVDRGFLVAAESCCDARGPNGWQAMHLALRGADRHLRGFLPLYRRHHWYGDFAMDYGWDAAWRQARIEYFPKLVTGVPFTPSPGPRLLVADGGGEATREALIAAAIEMTREIGASSWQCLFVREEDRSALAAAGLLMRRGVQFHWRNRGYRDFADFLQGFTAEKRKKMKRERRAVADAGLRIEACHGDEIDDRHWQAIHRHYCSTFERLGGLPSFSLEFFRAVGRSLGRRMVVFAAFDGDRPVASAICYCDGQALYGRHWGTDVNCPGLHFELCYHAGIEYAIARGLRRFEPGAQGEHKVARGFEPVSTWSAFWIAHPGLRTAVARMLAREEPAVVDYQTEMSAHLPYRLGNDGD